MYFRPRTMSICEPTVFLDPVNLCYSTHFRSCYHHKIKANTRWNFYNTCLVFHVITAISFPEAAILLVSVGDRYPWPGPTPRFTDFPSLCACSESSLTNLIGCGLNLLCLHSHSKPECRWAWPGVPIFPAHDKRDPSGRG